MNQHSAFQKELLRWYAANKRDLPWRNTKEPYHILVSEVMLQQTQMETVLPYYERWMRVFPDIGTLAKSPQEKVLKLWEGLGYYSRARNLHQTAQEVVEKYNAEFPSDFKAIHSLKGIGRYSAGAIASIAFNQEKPIVDGNVLRVLSRVYTIDKPIDVLKNTESFWELQEKLIPKGQARYFNQALMELGALICTPANPGCGLCPIREHCKARQENRQEHFPVRQKRKKTVKIDAAAVIFRSEGLYLLRQRPLGQIMGGLWEFPEWKLSRNKPLSADQIKKRAQKEAEKHFKIKTVRLKHLGAIKRNYTHHLEKMEVYLAETAQGDIQKEEWPQVWIEKKDFKKYPFSSAHAKIAQLILAAESAGTSPDLQ